MSFQTMAMQSLEELYKEHSAKEKADLYRNQYFLETMLRWSAASFYMVGGDDPEIDNLGDFFRNMAFGFAVIIDAKEKDKMFLPRSLTPCLIVNIICEIYSSEIISGYFVGNCDNKP